MSNLLAWINSHDCGVSPTGVLLDNGSIEIRCIAIERDGTLITESDIVTTYGEARAVLGY